MWGSTRSLLSTLSHSIVFFLKVSKITGKERHDRPDHNHCFRRVAMSTRKGNYNQLEMDGFDGAVKAGVGTT